MSALICYSRLDLHQHWASDVFFGSAIGYYTGMAVVHWHHPKRPRDPHKAAFMLVPGTAGGGYGLSLMSRF